MVHTQLGPRNSGGPTVYDRISHGGTSGLDTSATETGDAYRLCLGDAHGELIGPTSYDPHEVSRCIGLCGNVRNRSFQGEVHRGAVPDLQGQGVGFKVHAPLLSLSVCRLPPH